MISVQQASPFSKGDGFPRTEFNPLFEGGRPGRIYFNYNINGRRIEACIHFLTQKANLLFDIYHSPFTIHYFVKQLLM